MGRRREDMRCKAETERKETALNSLRGAFSEMN